ncbi:MAG TPA: hypothetical protein VFM08_13280 [Nocardioides sp.]|nr:hypothetical protein [Nocardioides sp.]
MEQRPPTASTVESTPSSHSVVTVPRSVELAIRATWGLVVLLAVLTLLLWVFRDDVVGSWASGHEGAREVFDQGGREGLERAGFAPPSFMPVAATMTVVGAMLVWVLAAVFRLGHRWGQLGLFALLVASAYLTVALGFVLAPPAVFVVLAVVALLVEGLAAACLWHPDTRAFLAGPWAERDEDGAAAASSDRPA